MKITILAAFLALSLFGTSEAGYFGYGHVAYPIHPYYRPYHHVIALPKKVYSYR